MKSFLLLVPATLICSLPIGFFKEKLRKRSPQRWILELVPFVALSLLPFNQALPLASLYVAGQHVGANTVAVGLTGGIATGKSTVSKQLKELGAVIVDADIIAREVVMPGRAAHTAIVKNFGRKVLNKDGSLNRAKLGGIIFSDPSKRQLLNTCTHKYILLEMFKQLMYYRLIKSKRLVVFDAPLLFETHFLEYFCYPIIVVACSESKQLERLIKRDNIKLEDAEKRVKSQMKLSEKVARADMVIPNDDSLEKLIETTKKTFQQTAQLVGATHELKSVFK